ncbi:ribose/xylose/arabinose/galactoside ABC-type transport system permease subunit [Kibdelosporangium banguiense]|uniref:Ribose/xylose/arabinose/galactoside ABC-type transport system permease subunit n=1 Tax=Kibdelosporangium banguiense TaxID=1365924 RepID=A0ABS4TXU7_9PSEU|nr:hypothetical protein [Kibdelosporangium banguiense]MBP2328838.1 ribose/xylose/arabinose/galactoside ABC-type transport system permease subunit [Kibdelosporangium banguiense]
MAPIKVATGIALLVLAQTMVLVVGKMDLSLESTFGLAPGVAAWLTITGGHSLGLLPGWAALPVVLLVGVLVGALNALLIVRFGLGGFVVTLGMLIVLRGLLTGVSGGRTFFGLPDSMLYLGTTLWAGIPASIWLCLLLFAGGTPIAAWATRCARDRHYRGAGCAGNSRDEGGGSVVGAVLSPSARRAT